VPTYFIDVRADFSGGNPVATVDDIAVRTDANPNPTSPTQFLSALTNAIYGKDVLFGTHGFHVDRPGGIANLSHWTEWLQLGNNGFFVGVLWPGDSRWVPFIDYPVEGDEAIRSGKLLAAYLLKNLTGAATWSFTSHSLGARVVLEAIRGLNGSPKLKSATLMAGAIDDTCLTDEYQDAVSQLQKVSVLASHCDEALKLAFPAGNLISGIITRGDPYWHGALGRYGPNPPDQPSQLYGTPILPDTWDFGHGSYINCDSAVTRPPQESGPFPAESIVVPSDNQAALPSPALSAANTQITNWRQALAAGFVSSRF
jgi:hypothetical protein